MYHSIILLIHENNPVPVNIVTILCNPQLIMFMITITTHHLVYIEGTTCVNTGYHMCIYRVPHVCIQGATCVYTLYHMGKQCSIWISSGTVALMVFATDFTPL